MPRPTVSNETEMKIIKILDHPLSKNFDQSLSELIRMYRRLERTAKKSGVQ